MDAVGTIQPWELADIIRCKSEKVLIVDARTFCEFNTSHIVNSVNVWSSKIRKKRLQQNSISVHDFLQQACHISLQEVKFDEVVVYDQSATLPHLVPPDTFLHVLLLKLSSSFSMVFLLQGGFLEFQSQFYEMCEDSSQKSFLLTSFSQPCLPIANTGPTKILPFLFLGSQHDANNKQQLLEHNISYELNVSTSCPKPDFLQDSHFLRIAVNDNFSARLLPHFAEAFHFIDKVREMGGRVLVHCLAGISRSPTVVISYVMKYLHLHYDEAYRYVKTRRPTISPNINFVGQLLELDLVLFGNRGHCRSPPGALYLEPEYTVPCRARSPSANSLLAKSSSSPCIESFDETDFPFHRNRSLPSLRLQKSLEERPNHPVPPGVHHRHQSFLYPSSDITSLLSNLSVVDDPRQPCVSDRLPSTPVFHEPGSAEYSAVLALCVDQTLDGPRSWDPCQPIPGGRSPSLRISEIEDENKEASVKQRESKETSESSELRKSSKEIDEEKNHEVKNAPDGNNILPNAMTSTYTSCTRDEDSSTKNRNEVTVSDVKQLSAQNNSVVTREDVVDHSSSSVTYSSKDSSENVEDNPNNTLPTSPKEEENKLAPINGTTENTLSVALPHAKSSEAPPKSGDWDRAAHHLQHSKPFLFPPATAAPSKKDGHFTSDSNNNSSCTSQQEATSPFPPKTAGKSHHPARKTDPPYLPRSHSSSETYLNRRTRLERQAASNPGGANTRKSFSSDEVGRGFQSLCLHPSILPPAAPASQPPAGVHHKETYTNPMELARCDSWSTSGLGSEISDWDSIQGDTQTVALLEDAQGPFDAVFSEVFPGEGQSPSGFREPPPPPKKLPDKGSSKEGEKIEKKLSFYRDKKDVSQGSSYASSSKSALFSAAEDPLVTFPTPRPISLPGVSGTYNITDPNANVDMGVGLEESGDWHKEDVETVTYSPSTARKNQILIEHPPVNPRTMGEDVKYIMTWYKIDSSPQQATTSEVTTGGGGLSAPDITEKSSKVQVGSTQMRGEKILPGLQTHLRRSSFPQREHNKNPVTMRNDSLHSKSSHNIAGTAAEEKQSDTESPSLGKSSVKGEEGCLQERWQWWDTKFKEKIQNIQKNVSLTSWDSVSGDEGGGGLASDSMTGFHLAEELMQSMEDLLEREIRDIKKRASALSTRFGLPVGGTPSRAAGESSSTVPPPSDEDQAASSVAKKEVPKTGGTAFSVLQREHPSKSSSSCRRENGLRATSFALGGTATQSRAKSEPPLLIEEGLYRVKSCPGIAQGEGTSGEGIMKRMPQEMGVLGSASTSFKFPQLFLSRNGSSKRFSCSALDFLSKPPSHFESSCPDVREIAAGGALSSAPFSRGESGGSGSGGSPSASFIRLLKVS